MIYENLYLACCLYCRVFKFGIREIDICFIQPEAFLLLSKFSFTWCSSEFLLLKWYFYLQTPYHAFFLQYFVEVKSTALAPVASTASSQEYSVPDLEMNGTVVAFLLIEFERNPVRFEH